MPLPPFLISASVLVCERVLREVDGVLSAIRVVDIFYIRDPEPHKILVHGLVTLKTQAGYDEEHDVELRLIDPTGAPQSLWSLRTSFLSKLGTDVPGGLGANMEMHVRSLQLGMYFLCVHLDGEEIARAPFTLLRAPDKGTSDQQ